MKYLPLLIVFLVGVILSARVRGLAPFIPSV